MKFERPVLEWQTQSGEPVTVGATTLTPEAQALLIAAPWGGFVWKRPLAIHVTQDGATRRLPIIDPTRIALLVFAGVSFGITLGVTLAGLVARALRDAKK